MTTLYDVPAPAKINLFLHVTGRRPDGYHLLQTAFRLIGLYDYLDIERRGDGVIAREGQGLDGLAQDDDLVVRAARLLQQVTGSRYGAQLSYRKTIPAGGGLGGGSSNAASTLIALNRLWNTGLSRHDLQQLGARLGSDVPVFIYGQSAFAQGTGDEFQPLSLPDASYLLIQPDAAMSTAEVFSAPDLTRDTEPITISIFTDWQQSLASQDADHPSVYFGRNDLEPIAFALDPGVRATSLWLQQLGINARMTGSGACFFVECTSSARASKHKQKILGKISQCSGTAPAVIRQMWVCPGLHEHPLKYWIHS